jgi:hypothetical protein
MRVKEKELRLERLSRTTQEGTPNSEDREG